jgi:hypothetical protein
MPHLKHELLSDKVEDEHVGILVHHCQLVAAGTQV